MSMSSNRKRSYTDIETISNILEYLKKNADISILVYFLISFSSREQSY